MISNYKYLIYSSRFDPCIDMTFHITAIQFSINSFISSVYMQLRQHGFMRRSCSLSRNNNNHHRRSLSHRTFKKLLLLKENK